MSDKIFIVDVGEVAAHTFVRGRDESDSVDESYTNRERFLFRARGLNSSESESDGTVSSLLAEVLAATWDGPGCSRCLSNRL